MLLALIATATLANADVHVLGEMRAMFMQHDIRPNVDLAKINKTPHLYALGPIAGLKGEITVSDGQVFVSKAAGAKPLVKIDENVKSVFLVYSSVPSWRSIDIRAAVVDENQFAEFIGRQFPPNSRSAFLVEGTVESAKYHIQNYKGLAKDLTHEAHEKSKVFYKISNARMQLVGFFTNREGDGGSFVHMGQTTHIHIISADHKHMGHLESIRLAPGAKLLLPEQR